MHIHREGYIESMAVRVAETVIDQWIMHVLRLHFQEWRDICTVRVEIGHFKNNICCKHKNKYQMARKFSNTVS